VVGIDKCDTGKWNIAIMEKDLPPKLNSEILKQLATEKLVEIIVEPWRAIAIEQLKSLLNRTRTGNRK
jgi:hypothetical protein